MDLDLGPHAITAVLERDQVRLRLVCPGAPLCKSYYGCSDCDYGNTFDDDDKEVTCPGCNGLGHNEICALTDWFDNIAAEEMFDGCDVDLAGLTFPIPIRVLYWNPDEGPVWDVVRPGDEASVRVATFTTADKIKPTAMDGCGLIDAERRRQIWSHDWTLEHDDTHTGGELRLAALCYLREACGADFNAEAPDAWPWTEEAWKPGERGGDLIKAGALIAAELDRLQRAGWRP